MNTLQAIVEVVLPGDSELGMPSAAAIGYEDYLSRYRLQDVSDSFVVMLESVCQQRYGRAFVDLDLEQKLLSINACKLINVRVFSAFVSHLFKAYYTSPEVLMRIGAGSVPPFPSGNPLENDDWGILEPVFNRGKIYRDVM